MTEDIIVSHNQIFNRERGKKMFGETIKFSLNRMRPHRTEWKDIGKSYG